MMQSDDAYMKAVPPRLGILLYEEMVKDQFDSCPEQSSMYRSIALPSGRLETDAVV